MSSRLAARVRRRVLALPGFTKSPRCESCGQQIAVHAYWAHAKQCARDVASLTIEATERHIRALENTVPANPAHALLLDLELAGLEQDRAEAYNCIFGLSREGKGRVRTEVAEDDFEI